MEGWRKFVNEGVFQGTQTTDPDANARVQYYVTDHFKSHTASLDNPNTISIHMDGEPLEGGFQRVVKELEGVELFDPDYQETFTFTLENWRNRFPHAEDDDDLIWEVMSDGIAPFLIEEWAKLQGTTATWNNDLPLPPQPDGHD